MSQIKNIILENLPPSSWAYRALSFFIAGSYISSLPFVIFSFYMLNQHFFSYDFFVEGVVGLKVFFAVFLFIICTFAGMTGCFLINHAFKARAKKQNNSNTHKGNLFICLLITLFYIFIMVLFFISNKTAFKAMIMASFFGVGLAIYISMAIAGNAKNQFMTLLGIIAVNYVVIFLFNSQISELVSYTLRAYGIGGGIKVEIHKNDKDKEKIEGNLLLASPKNIYIRANKNKIETLPRLRYDRMSITVKNQD